MRPFLKKILLAVVLLVVGGALLLNLLLDRMARSEDFKRFAEQKVGEYLKARVHIGAIRPYHFTQLALEKILIETPSAKGGSQLIRIERLLFRYGLDQLWNRQVNVPAGVVLKNPAILIEQDQFPYDYFASSPKSAAGVFVPSLDFQGGEIRYLLSSLGKEIVLTDMDGGIRPASDGRVSVDLHARASGLMSGQVRIRGTIDPLRNQHDLWLKVDDMNLASDIPLPFKALSGRVHWTDHDLFFEGLRGTLYGWSAELSGDFLGQEGKPEMNLHLRIGKGEPWLKLDFALNLFSQSLKGSFQPFGAHAVDFEGKVHQDGRRFVMDSLDVGPGYQGNGELDFASGNYELNLSKGSKRMAVHSNLRGLDFVLNFHLDHVKALGMDFVTQGKLYLHSLSPRWQSREFLFRGEFETDYFILNQQPFKDLRGNFDLSPLGVTGIRCSWGKEFQLTGKATGRGKNPYLDLLVNVTDFDLGTVQEFFARPLPRALGGRLSGKLSLEGDFAKPEVSGIFNVYDGKWGQLNYDRGIIQLRGFLPYLPLKDSKIWKGRTVLFLTGALDLNLGNIFAGVKVQTPDKLVIWKGIEAALHPKGNVVEMNTAKLGQWGELSVMEARAAGSSQASEDSPDENDEKNDQEVVFGPKLKF